MSFYDNDSGTWPSKPYAGNSQSVNLSSSPSPSSGALGESNSSTTSPFDKKYSYYPFESLRTLDTVSPFGDPAMPGVSPFYYALRMLGSRKMQEQLPHFQVSRGTAMRIKAAEDHDQAMQMPSPEDQKMGFRTDDLVAGAFPALLALMFGGKKGGGLAANYLTGYLGGKQQGLKDANDGRTQEFQEAQKQALAHADSEDLTGQLLAGDEQGQFNRSMEVRQINDRESQMRPYGLTSDVSEPLASRSLVEGEKAGSNLDIAALNDSLSRADGAIADIVHSKGKPLGAPLHDRKNLEQGIAALQKMRNDYLSLVPLMGNRTNPDLVQRITAIDAQISQYKSALGLIPKAPGATEPTLDIKPPFLPFSRPPNRSPYILRPRYIA